MKANLMMNIEYYEFSSLSNDVYTLTLHGHSDGQLISFINCNIFFVNSQH